MHTTFWLLDGNCFHKQLVAYVLTILFMNWNIIVHSVVVINIFLSSLTKSRPTNWLYFEFHHQLTLGRAISKKLCYLSWSCLFMLVVFVVRKINLSASTSLLSQLAYNYFHTIISRSNLQFYFSFSNELFLPLHLPSALHMLQKKRLLKPRNSFFSMTEYFLLVSIAAGYD